MGLRCYICSPITRKTDPMTPLIETPKFFQRQKRTAWLHQYFRHIFQTKILDVGCYDAPLRKIVGADNYKGIDISGNPDFRIDLETVETLPFEDNSFDTVICIEVLEHLDNLHVIASDLFRISQQYVLISLPNSWRDARLKIERGKGGIAHYGLPPQKPQDRHKWFFNAQEAASFLERLSPPGWKCDVFFTMPKRPLSLTLYRKIRYSEQSFINRYAQTGWALYEKRKAP